MNLRSLFALGSLVLFMVATSACAADQLRICLDENAEPFSFNHQGISGGFDVKIAQFIADRLGRELTVQWFASESQPESEKNTKTSIASLLADDRCDISGSYPLLVDALDPLSSEGRLPRFKGGKREDQGRPITLYSLMATAPIIYTAPAVVLASGASDEAIHTLADLDGLRIGVEQSSWPDVILSQYQYGRLLTRLKHIPPGGGLLDRLEAGEYDAVLVDLHRIDAYRLAHPKTALRLTDFVYPVGFNLGFVSLARNAELVHDINAIIQRAMQDGTIARLAASVGLTYLPPRGPPVRLMPALAELPK